MCGHDVGGSAGGPRSNVYGVVTRRGLLKAGAAVAAGLGASVGAPRAVAAAAAGTAPAVGGALHNGAGVRGWRSAMHVHTSLSEMTGSVESQLQQAALNGFDVLHLSDHDARGFKKLFRRSYGFTARELQYGGAWDVAPISDVGRPMAPVDGLVRAPVSPGYVAGEPAGSLRIALSAPAGSAASRCYQLVNGFTPTGATATRANWNGSVAGDVYSVDVLTAVGGPSGWADVYLTLSHHPAAGGRPAGVRQVHYRLRSDLTQRVYSTHGLVGVVDVPVQLGAWTTVTFDVAADATALWPGTDGRDNALTGTQFWATAQPGGAVDVYFSRLLRTPTGSYDPVGLQHDLLTGLAPTAPRVHAYPGLEYSFDDAVHINGFGGTPGWFGYDSQPNSSSRPLYPSYGPGLPAALVTYIHNGGGLASLNHLLGFVPYDTRTPAAQDQHTRQVVTSLLTGGSAGADLLEVGYRQRAGYTLDHQLQMWDALTRNGIWMTGNGTSDDHTGVDWADQTNNGYTTTWGAGTGLGQQLAALSAGRAFVGFLGQFAGGLDLRLDGGKMGSISVDSQLTRQLHIDLTGLPAGGAVEIIQIPVDYAGTADPTAGSTMLRRLAAADLASAITVDTSRSVAYRANVLDANGQIVAFSQPCWSLTTRPPTVIPANRAAPDTTPG